MCMCVCEMDRRPLELLSGVASGCLLAEIISILLLLFYMGRWEWKFSNVFCNP